MAVQTLFGNFTDEQLKNLKGAIDEMIVVMHKQDALKLEMDTFLESELGLDVNKLNKELENMTNNLTSANE